MRRSLIDPFVASLLGFAHSIRKTSATSARVILSLPNLCVLTQKRERLARSGISGGRSRSFANAMSKTEERSDEGIYYGIAHKPARDSASHQALALFRQDAKVRQAQNDTGGRSRSFANAMSKTEERSDEGIYYGIARKPVRDPKRCSASFDPRFARISASSG